MHETYTRQGKAAVYHASCMSGEEIIVVTLCLFMDQISVNASLRNVVRDAEYLCPSLNQVPVRESEISMSGQQSGYVAYGFGIRKSYVR